MKRDEPKSLRELATRTRYPVDAFHFVRRGLDYTVRRAHKDPERLPVNQRHVSGRQLSQGLRDFAVEQYGLLARTVLQRWRVTRTEDFGRIVFTMVEGKLMQATESDTIRDFESVFGFDEAFESTVRLDRVSQDGLEPDPVEKE